MFLALFCALRLNVIFSLLQTWYYCR